MKNAARIAAVAGSIVCMILATSSAHSPVLWSAAALALSILSLSNA